METVTGQRPATAESQGSPRSGSAQLTLRGWVLALAAQVAILLWVVRTEITARVFVSSWTLSMPGVILLLALLGWNACRKGRGFTRAELLGAFVAVSSTATLAGYNFLQVLIPTLGTGLYFQTPENGWARVLQYLPAWLLPQDREALRGLFHGESAVPWAAWGTPLLAWGSLVLAISLAGLALNTLLADLWIRKERLAFPIASIPLEMTAPGTDLFRSRLMWLGFAVPVVLNSLMALHYYYPAIPAVELKHRDVWNDNTLPPFSILKPMDVGFTPFIIGLAYLAPLDVSFSIWFFEGFAKGERVLAYLLGFMGPDGESPGAPFLNEQCVGAFLALGLLLLWRVWPRPSERNAEPGSGTGDRPLVRVAQGVLALSLLYVFGFMLAAGFSPLLAGELLLLYFLTVLTISRVRSEAGFAWAYGPNRFSASASHVLVNVHGTAALSQRGIAVMSFFHWLWWDLRFALMPAQMDALKIGDAVGIRRRQLVALMTAALVVAIAVGLPWVLHDSYRFGWGTAKTYIGPSAGARQAYNMGVQWLDNGTYPQWDRIVWMVLGALFTLFLGGMRQRFVWWPFHPIGYAMAATATSVSFWGHYLIAWAIKSSVLRYGGMRLYRQSLPLVLGVILGDVASQTLWSLGASLLDLPVYQFVS